MARRADKQRRDNVEIIKPPLGVKPHEIQNQQRISELARAIKDQIEYIQNYNIIPKDGYMCISEWSREITALSSFECAEYKLKEE